MKTMTEKQAYAAMFRFLDGIYRRTKFDQLGAVLGGMSLLHDGCPADPAVTADWAEAVDYAISGGQPEFLEIAFSPKT